MQSTDIRKILDESSQVLLFAGAGLSQELGISTYWSGSMAKYASNVSEYGFTALEHSSAGLWESEPSSQSKYFHDAYVLMEESQKNHLQNSSYTRIREYLETQGKEYFVVTSNVDSAFVNAAYPPERIYEVHGSYRTSQCLQFPFHKVFPTDIHVENTPCPECGSMSRPNVLFFDDYWFNETVINEQWTNYIDFGFDKNTVILEIGVGVAVPKIRQISFLTYLEFDIPYIHINPEPQNLITGFEEQLNSHVSPEIWIKETTPVALDLLNLP